MQMAALTCPAQHRNFSEKQRSYSTPHRGRDPILALEFCDDDYKFSLEEAYAQRVSPPTRYAVVLRPKWVLRLPRSGYTVACGR
jgi:hypothetical protein